MSLKTYTAEAIKQNAIKATIDSNIDFILKNFNEKINGINTTKFLT